ncbi:MAG TPA: AraC family ligand binding domain-containing protein [Fermentimonas sp.]|nr:AraC family ligand binding domain-containing protein [Fermentimonas sp.]
MKDLDTSEFILLNVGFATHHADWNYKNIHSPFARIYLVKEGMAKLHLPNHEVQELTPGYLYMIPPFMLHSYECDEYFTLYYIHYMKINHQANEF